MYYKNTTPNSGYTVPLGYVGIAARQMYRHGKAYDVSRLHRKSLVQGPDNEFVSRWRLRHRKAEKLHQ